jgi:hypothetical protein
MVFRPSRASAVLQASQSPHTSWHDQITALHTSVATADAKAPKVGMPACAARPELLSRRRVQDVHLQVHRCRAGPEVARYCR